VEVSVVLVAELGDEDAMLPHRIGESTRGHWWRFWRGWRCGETLELVRGIEAGTLGRNWAEARNR